MPNLNTYTALPIHTSNKLTTGMAETQLGTMYHTAVCSLPTSSQQKELERTGKPRGWS